MNKDFFTDGVEDIDSEDERIDSGLTETNQQVTDVNKDNQALNDEVVNPVSIEQPADDFDGTKWQLNYKGEFIAPKSREELIALAQKGIGYSKSQELINQEKQRLQESLNQVKPYLELDKRFREDPNLQAHIQKAMEEYNGQRQPTDPMLQNIMERLNEFEEVKTNYQTEQMNTEVQREIQELRAAYPNEDWDNGMLQKVGQHYLDNNLPNLKLAYRDYKFDNVVSNTKAEALKEAERKKAEALKAGKVGGNSSSNIPLKTVEYSPEDSYSDLKAKALAMLS